MSRGNGPTFEETEALLRAPFQDARVAIEIYAYSSRLEVGTIVRVRPYHNDPDGWVSIRFTDESGELHEFTEHASRIEYTT